MGLKRRNSLTGVRRLHHHRHDHSTNEEYQNIKSVRSRRSLSDFDDEFEEVAVLHDKQEAVGYDDNMLDFGCIDCMDTFFFMDFFRDPLSCDSREDGESGREGVKVPVKVNVSWEKNCLFFCFKRKLHVGFFLWGDLIFNLLFCFICFFVERQQQLQRATTTGNNRYSRTRRLR